MNKQTDTNTDLYKGKAATESIAKDTDTGETTDADTVTATTTDTDTLIVIATATLTLTDTMRAAFSTRRYNSQILFNRMSTVKLLNSARRSQVATKRTTATTTTNTNNTIIKEI